MKKFEKHIGEKVNKTNSIFAVIRRSYINLNADTFLPLYKSMVGSQLDYASSIWAHHEKKLVDKIEQVTRREQQSNFRVLATSPTQNN